MSVYETIAELRSMQKQIIHGKNFFGETADLLMEASYLIEQIGTTGAERTDVIRKAGEWLNRK